MSFSSHSLRQMFLCANAASYPSASTYKTTGIDRRIHAERRGFAEYVKAMPGGERGIVALPDDVALRKQRSSSRSTTILKAVPEGRESRRAKQC